jgi:outer membrane lipoprotein-sorting protein
MKNVFKILSLTVASLFITNSASALTVKAVEAYLNGLSTYTAEFQQVDDAGNYATGNFYLKRPYKLLWEYDAPFDQKIVATGTKMFFVDGESGQATQLPMNSGLPSLLIRKNIMIENNKFYSIPKIVEEDGWALVTLTAKDADSFGATPQTLEFTFKTKPEMQLKRLSTESTMGEKVVVTFSHIKEDVDISNTLFYYDYSDPFSDF